MKGLIHEGTCAADQIADARGVEGHAIHAHTEGTQRILDRAGHRGGDGYRAGLARALDAEGVDRARHVRPWTTPPRIWPSTISGLITLPQSWPTT